MLVDWFTVGAQALNFIVLVWLLKRYLYKPIIDAIDARETRIADELASAEATKAEANTERLEFERKNAVFDQERSALLLIATEEAQAERRRLIEEARQEADALSAKRREALRSELRALNKAIGARTKQEVFAIARQLLKDLASADLEDCMVSAFEWRLREIGDNEKATLTKSIKASSDPGLVRSAFDLTADHRSKLNTAFIELFGADTRIRFETAPDVISGMEFTVGGEKIAWSVQNYLGSLERDVGAMLDGQYSTGSRAVHEPAVSAVEVRPH